MRSYLIMLETNKIKIHKYSYPDYSYQKNNNIVTRTVTKKIQIKNIDQLIYDLKKLNILIQEFYNNLGKINIIICENQVDEYEDGMIHEMNKYVTNNIEDSANIISDEFNNIVIGQKNNNLVENFDIKDPLASNYDKILSNFATDKINCKNQNTMNNYDFKEDAMKKYMFEKDDDITTPNNL